jgi:hypothetical protein
VVSVGFLWVVPLPVPGGVDLDPGTWRRLKTAAELRMGHGLPRLPPGDIRLLAGLLASIEAGEGRRAVADPAVQEAFAVRVVDEAGAEAGEVVKALAHRVDVAPFL